MIQYPLSFMADTKKDTHSLYLKQNIKDRPLKWKKSYKTGTCGKPKYN